MELEECPHFYGYIERQLPTRLVVAMGVAAKKISN